MAIVILKKIFETYKNDEFVSTLLSQISWSNHLAIMSKAKTEERHFYITLCVKENYLRWDVFEINNGELIYVNKITGGK